VSFNIRDVAAGGIFILFGLAFGIDAMLELKIGTALRMGPGYFPLILGTILIGLGAAIVVQGLRLENVSLSSPSWRALALILLSPLVFGVTVRGLGLVPAILLSSGIAVFASRRTTPMMALSVPVGLAVLCVLIFKYGLGLLLPLFGPWLHF
jgi:hypothetical protein